MQIETVTVRNSQELDMAVRDRLEDAVSHFSHVVLLVPGFADDLRFRKLFSATPLSFGVEVSGFDAWVDDQWELYGDGRVVVSGVQRELLLGRILSKRAAEGASFELGNSPGTVKLLSQIAQEALGVLVGQGASPADARMCHEGGGRIDDALPSGDASSTDVAQEDSAAPLTAAKLEVLEVMRKYADGLECTGLCERTQAMLELAKLPSEGLCLVLAGFDEFSYVQERYLESLATSAAVLNVVDEATLPASAPGRAAELVELQGSVFKPDPEHPVAPTGAVRFLLPSGRYAAPALIGKELVERLDKPSKGSSRKAILVARDPERMFYALAPFLDKHGISCTLSARKRFGATDFGKAFSALVHFLTDSGNDTFLLSDFTSSTFSGLSSYRASELDAAWRGDRSCDKSRCLADLVAQSAPFAQFMKVWEADGAAAALGTFEQAVKTRFDWSEAYRAEQQAAIAVALRYMEAVESLDNGSLAEGGGRFGSSILAEDDKGSGASSRAETVKSSGNNLGSETLLETLLLLQRAPVACSAAYTAESGSPDDQPRVDMMSFDEAAALPACSYDFAFSCEMDAQSFPVQNRQTAKTLLFEKLGLSRPADALAQARRQFFRFLSLPTQALVCERELNTVDASSAYPSVMFEELNDCYRDDLVSFSSIDKATGLAKALVRHAKQAGEEALYENLAIEDSRQPMQSLGPLPPSGVVGDEARALIVLPPANSQEAGAERMFLSPSAMESYLECPYKWFTLRRLRLQGLDAGFGALEMGSFSHWVLKSAYHQLKDEGVAKIKQENLARAQEVLSDVFDRHLAEQPNLTRVDNPLIACNSLEEAEIAELKKKLMRYFERETELLPGFAPRYFERNFGEKELFEYAGALVHGCIDRIDVNDRDQAVVIDYKGSVSKDYAFASSSDLPWVAAEEPVVLPHRIQTLIYAQAVRKTLGLEVVGALYVPYGKKTQVAGAYDRTVLDAGDLLGIDIEACGISPSSEGGFAEVLDQTEASIAQALEYLQDGFIEPWPRGGDPCAFCPVQVCEKRRS